MPPYNTEHTEKLAAVQSLKLPVEMHDETCLKLNCLRAWGLWLILGKTGDLGVWEPFDKLLQRLDPTT